MQLGFKNNTSFIFGQEKIRNYFLEGTELLQLPEYVPEIRRFDKVLKNHNYKNLRYEFRDDTYHSSTKPEGFTRGIKFIFELFIKK